MNLGSTTSITQTIYVRLESGLLEATYNDQIYIAGGGVPGTGEILYDLSGEVTPVIPPTITSSLAETVVYGITVSYQITASDNPTSYSASGLPAGLTINTVNGGITGTVTEDVGTVNSTIQATNSGGTDTETLVWTITPKPLTMTGISGMNKVYDGNTSASLSGVGSEVLVGIFGSDFVDVPATGTPTATFLDKNVATGKSLTIIGYNLVGTEAGNYTLTLPTLTANITSKPLTISGASANNKVYDGTNSATISGGTLSGVISPDVVTLSGGGTFANADVGNVKTVTASLTLGGAGASNYTLTQPTGLSADITKATPVFTTSVININLGGTYGLPGVNVSSTSPGVFSYSITGGGNATLSGTTITGAVVGTETLTVNQAAGGNYNAGSITVSVNVITVSFTIGDYRSTSNGSWHSTAASSTATWKQLDGTGILRQLQV